MSKIRSLYQAVSASSKIFGRENAFSNITFNAVIVVIVSAIVTSVSGFELLAC